MIVMMMRLVMMTVVRMMVMMVMIMMLLTKAIEGGKNMDLESLSGFKFTCHHLLVMRLWASFGLFNPQISL